MKNPKRRQTPIASPDAPDTFSARRTRAHASRLGRRTPSPTGEGGYTLVALLALMAILMLAVAAAAPNIRQQKQRELEMEAIARGEEVAEAIRLYVRRPGPGTGTLPTTMEQLLEGIPFGTKKIKILRPSAARDPLSTSGEWRLIRPRDREMIEFKDAVVKYASGRPIQTLTYDREALNKFVTEIMNFHSSGSSDSGDRDGGEHEGTNPGGPFIGVASRSRRASVVTYYGLEHHDKWVFTPLFR